MGELPLWCPSHTGTRLQPREEPAKVFLCCSLRGVSTETREFLLQEAKRRSQASFELSRLYSLVQCAFNAARRGGYHASSQSGDVNINTETGFYSVGLFPGRGTWRGVH